MEGGIKIAFNWRNILWLSVFVVAVSLLFVLGSFVLEEKRLRGEETQNDIEKENNGIQVEIEDLKLGEGPEVKENDVVAINYVGRLENGIEFDNSLGKKPLEFKVGAEEVIQGLDEGILGIKVGGKRKITIPPGLGYGEVGFGEKIPPNSTLIFEVDLLEIK